MKLKVFICILSVLSLMQVIAQKPSQLIKKGNELYKGGNYNEAEILYRKALETPDKWYQKALYNLGNSLIKQGNFEDAEKLYEQLAFTPDIKAQQKTDVFHNYGNSLVEQEKYKEAIEAYKNALRINHKDEDTRYNLSYAIRKLKEQEEQSQSKQDQKQDKEQEQDQKQDKDNNQEQQQDPRELSRQDIERMLNALSNKDKETIDELRKKELVPVKIHVEKDW